MQGRDLREREDRMMPVPSVSVGQVATQLGVSAGTIRNWIEKGYVHAIRLPSGVRRIPETEVHRLVDEVFHVASEDHSAPAVRLTADLLPDDDDLPAV